MVSCCLSLRIRYANIPPQQAKVWFVLSALVYRRLIIVRFLPIVGVVGSGQGVTTYEQRGKHVFSRNGTNTE